MYGLMVAFDTTRETSVARGHNEGLNFGKVVETGNGYHGGGGVRWRKLECWYCVGYHLKNNCPKRAEEKEKTKKDNGGTDDKRADKKTELNGGQLYTMFTSLVDITSGAYFSGMGEDEEFTCHQFHVEGWGAQYFEGNTPGAMHNTNGRAVTLTWLLLDSQFTVELVADKKNMVNIRNVQAKDSIRVYSNDGYGKN